MPPARESSLETPSCHRSTKPFPILAALTVLASLLISLPVEAATFVVPDYTPTIQAAIDSAAGGDTVLVREGTYVENLQIHEKSLTLEALGSAEATIIDGNQAGSVIEVIGDAHVEGFTIRNGRGYEGGGVLFLGTSEAGNTLKLLHNIIADNRAGLTFDLGCGGGVALYACEDCVIEGNTIRNNYAGDSGGGLATASGNPQIRNNRFMANGCHATGGAILLDYASYDVIVEGNLILENWSDYNGGGIGNRIDGALPVTIRHNTIARNYHNNRAFLAGAGIQITSGPAMIAENIVAFNYGPSGRNTGVGVYCVSTYVTVQCNDVWGNEVEFHLVHTDTTGGGNISVDPLFCDPDNGDYTLAEDSPCREDGPVGCGLIGAFGVGCQQTPVVPMTWGRLKTVYAERR